MKKSYFIRTFAILVLVGASIFAINSCKKNVGPTDLLAQPIVVPTSSIVVSVFNSATTDTLTGSTVTVSGPSSLTATVVGKKYVVSNVKVSGAYTLTVTNTGFLPESKVINVNVLGNVSTLYSADIQLTQSAAPVTVVGAKGGVIPVKYSLGSSVGVGQVVMQKATTITQSDNTTVASVSIAATNIPLAQKFDPATGAYSTDIPTSGTAKALKTIDFQPSGLKFSKPLRVALYVGDIFVGLDAATIATLKNNFTFENNGTVLPVVAWSAAGDSAYFDVPHFSRWEFKVGIVINDVNTYFTVAFTSNAPCNADLNQSFANVLQASLPDYTSIGLFGKRGLKLVTKFSFLDAYSAVPGFSISNQHKQRHRVLRPSIKGISVNESVDVPTNDFQDGLIYSSCHNQGGN